MSKSIRILLHGIVVVFIVFFVVFAFWNRYNKGLFQVKMENVFVSGNHLLQEDEIRSNLPLSSGRFPSSIALPLNHWKEQILQNLYVEDVRLHVRYPNSVVIQITERKPIGRLGNGSSYWVDSSSVILPERPVNESSLHLPTIVYPQSSVNLNPGQVITTKLFRDLSGILGELSVHHSDVFRLVNRIKSVDTTTVELFLEEGTKAIITLNKKDQLKKLDAFTTQITAVKPLKRIRLIDLRFEHQIVIKEL